MSPPITCGKINKSLLFILLMSISSISNKYLYGFEYIDCFYVMNIYKSLYSAIIGIIDSEKKFPRIEYSILYLVILVLFFFRY